MVVVLFLLYFVAVKLLKGVQQVWVDHLFVKHYNFRYYFDLLEFLAEQQGLEVQELHLEVPKTMVEL